MIQFGSGTQKPLPFTPPPFRDELLSSWIRRLATSNFVEPDVLLEDIGLRPRPLNRFDGVLRPGETEAFAHAGRLDQASVRSMSFADSPRQMEPFISTGSDFQVCRGCSKLWNPVTRSFDTITLKHWRHSWALDCNVCGGPLEYTYPDSGWNTVYWPSKRHKRMARQGAEALGSAVERGDHRWLRRLQQALRLGAVLKGRPLAYAGLTHMGYAARIWCLCAIHRASQGPLRKAAWLYLSASAFGRYLIRDEFRDEPGLRHAVLRVADKLEVHKLSQDMKQLKPLPIPVITEQPAQKVLTSKPANTDIEKAVASSLRRYTPTKLNRRRYDLRKLLREADRELQALRKGSAPIHAQLKSH